MTLIQRFNSMLNLNIHFHMLFLDGVYVTGGETLCFRRVPPPTAAELDGLIGYISARVSRYLERQDLLVRAMENSVLAPVTEDGAALDALLSHSITYRIAVGPHQGRKAFTLQILPTRTDECDAQQVANAAALADQPGAHPLCIDNAVSRRDDARHLRALYFIARLMALVPKQRVNLTR